MHWYEDFHEARQRGLVLMLVGVAIGGVAGLITWATYDAASSTESGGWYLVLWGPIVYGGFLFLKGLAAFGAGVIRRRPPAPSQEELRQQFLAEGLLRPGDPWPGDVPGGTATEDEQPT